jgi:Leucine-rich repeat (LRR) protein
MCVYIQEYLFYAKTFFEYSGIPTYIGALTKLVEYDCSAVLYFGELREEIFTNLTQLQYLAMGDNSYNMATIPSQIIDLPNLQYLYLHNCDVQGNLEFLPTMNNMQEFWIDKNEGIIGTIPSDIGQMNGLGECTCTHAIVTYIYTAIAFSDSFHVYIIYILVSFSATECSLKGQLPTELGLLKNLRTYRASSNWVCVDISVVYPHFLFHVNILLLLLGTFWSSRNNLTGTIPTEIGSITKLEILELYDTGIIGSMPNQICNLVIPSSVGGNLTSLVVDCELNCTCCTSCL